MSTSTLGKMISIESFLATSTPFELTDEQGGYGYEEIQGTDDLTCKTYFHELACNDRTSYTKCPKKGNWYEF